ncbi:hypothetical protein BC835DRAFT_1309858 [Cytidiella melzeri]|nr:hypothetical protein BC835DRAFT_1309858 [Cytidiella melzeri]
MTTRTVGRNEQSDVKGDKLNLDANQTLAAVEPALINIETKRTKLFHGAVRKNKFEQYDDDVPDHPGLYVSPNAETLPEMPPKNLAPYLGGLPSPFPWLYARHANQNHYWTALCPKKPEYTGMLHPVDPLQITQDRDNRFRLRNVQEWRNLEALLHWVTMAQFPVEKHEKYVRKNGDFTVPFCSRNSAKKH